MSARARVTIHVREMKPAGWRATVTVDGEFYAAAEAKRYDAALVEATGYAVGLTQEMEEPRA